MSTGLTGNRPQQFTRVPREVVIDIEDESGSSGSIEDESDSSGSTESETLPQVSDLIKRWQRKTSPFSLALKEADRHSEQDLVSIGHALPSLHHLEDLTISAGLLGSMSTEATKSVGNGVARSSSLHTLKIRLDLASPDTAKALAACIRRNGSIKVLHLRGTRPGDLFPFLHFLTIPLKLFSDKGRKGNLGKLKTLEVSIRNSKRPPDWMRALLEAFFVGHGSLKTLSVVTEISETMYRYVSEGLIASRYDNAEFSEKTRASCRELLTSREAMIAAVTSLFSNPDDQRASLPQDLSAMLGEFIASRGRRGRQAFSGLLRATKAGHEAAMARLSENPQWAHPRLIQLAAAELSEVEAKQVGGIINPHLHESIKQITTTEKSDFSTTDVQYIAALLKYLMKVEQALSSKRGAARQQRQKEMPAVSETDSDTESDLRCWPAERPKNRTECLAAARQCITNSFIAAFLFIGTTALLAGAVALIWYVSSSDYVPPGARTPTPSPIN